MRWASSVRASPAKKHTGKCKKLAGSTRGSTRSSNAVTKRRPPAAERVPQKTHREVQRIGRERERVDRILHRKHEEAARARKNSQRGAPNSQSPRESLEGPPKQSQTRQRAGTRANFWSTCLSTVCAPNRGSALLPSTTLPSETCTSTSSSQYFANVSEIHFLDDSVLPSWSS